MNKNPLLRLKKLNTIQKISYFQSNFYWFFGFILLFQIITQFIWLFRLIFKKYNEENNRIDSYTYIFSYSTHLIFFFLLPQISFLKKLEGLIMFINYTPIYVYAFLSYLFPSYIKTSRSANKSKQNNFHFLFYFHILVILFIGLLTVWSFFTDLLIIEKVNILTILLSYIIAFSPVIYTLIKNTLCPNKQFDNKNDQCPFNINN